MTKTKAKKGKTSHWNHNIDDRALRELHQMKHRDLQRACIVRGMPFEEVVKDHQKLVSFFTRNYDIAQDESLLILYDLWMEKELEARGYKRGDAAMAPAFRFSFVPNIEDMDKIITPKPNKVNKTVEKKEKAIIDTITGVRSGTKKALTFQFSLEGLEIMEIIKKVKIQFPEAEEKSIKIWNKKCLREQKEREV